MSSNFFHKLTVGTKIDNKPCTTDLGNPSQYDEGTVIELYDSHCVIQWDGLTGDADTLSHEADELESECFRIIRTMGEVLDGPKIDPGFAAIMAAASEKPAIKRSEDYKFFAAVPCGHCPCGIVKSDCRYHS